MIHVIAVITTKPGERGKVLAAFQGHSHTDELEKKNGISYSTLAAMVDGSGAENSSYGIVDVFANGSVRINGYRKLKNRTVS